MARRIRRGSSPDVSRYVSDVDEGFDDVAEDEEAEEAPRRRRRISDDDRAPRRRRHDYDDDGDDEEDDDVPPRRRRRGGTVSTFASGWEGVRAARTGGGNYMRNLKIENKKTIIVKFLEEAPFVLYDSHFLPSIPGRKSFVCLGEGVCPLCDVGDRARRQVLFNVVDFSEADPQVRVWAMGIRLATRIKGLVENPRVGPLNKHYWAVTRTGTRTNTEYNLQVVREEHLEDGWGVLPLDSRELAELRAQTYTVDDIHIDSVEHLEKIADMIAA